MSEYPSFITSEVQTFTSYEVHTLGFVVLNCAAKYIFEVVLVQRTAEWQSF
jgi:hypothetical protein